MKGTYKEGRGKLPLIGKPIKLSPVGKFRKEWSDKGYDLVNISSLCTMKLGYSGWCNDFNEPDEECHHIQIWYRNECIANAHANKIVILDDTKFRKVKK
jgi:hypothetical protein